MSRMSLLAFLLQSLATWENENKIHCTQTLLEGDGPKTYWTRELANDELILVRSWPRSLDSAPLLPPSCSPTMRSGLSHLPSIQGSDTICPRLTCRQKACDDSFGQRTSLCCGAEQELEVAAVSFPPRPTQPTPVLTLRGCCSHPQHSYPSIRASGSLRAQPSLLHLLPLSCRGKSSKVFLVSAGKLPSLTPTSTHGPHWPLRARTSGRSEKCLEVTRRGSGQGAQTWRRGALP